jgi:hypothetical protein
MFDLYFPTGADRATYKLLASAAGFLYPIRGSCHYFRTKSHKTTGGGRQWGGAGLDCYGGMATFVLAHLFEDSATFFVVCGQAREVSFKMGYHLPLGFGDKTQAPLVADEASQRPDRE